MKCYNCGKRIDNTNSYKLVKEYDYRICIECTKNGYLNSCIEQIKHNENVERSDT